MEINNNFLQTNMTVQYGWQCPLCKRVLAPFISECPCKGQNENTWSTSIADLNVKNIYDLENDSLSKNSFKDINTYYSNNF